MRHIALSKGYTAIVDDEDYELVSEHKWFYQRGYARRWSSGKPRKVIHMSRVIMDTPKDMVVDHMNHNTIDNRKENLRICTRKQNVRNQVKFWGKSKYKGVSWDKANNKWLSGIMVDGKHLNLGRYKNETEAAEAYDRAAIKYFGDFAYVNFNS